MASPQQVGNAIGVATSAEEQRGRTLETIAIIGGTADLFEEMPEQLAIITGCMAQLAEGLRTNISRMDQINRALTRDVATLRYQTRARQDHSETDSDHGEPCEPDTSRQSEMQIRPVTSTPEPPESAHEIGDEPADQAEQYPERAVPPYPPLSPTPPPTLRGSVPELELCRAVDLHRCREACIMDVSQHHLLQPSWTDGVFYFVGAVSSTVFAILLLHELSVILNLYVFPRFGRRIDYLSKYGKWAVITGGSDGIGKQYALQLAKRGMNICIISNFENGIVETIRSQYDVEVKYMDIDFSSNEIYVQIEEELSQLNDIGILINNVGMVQSSPLPLAEADRKYLNKILNVNLTSMVMMTEIVLKRMVLRNKGLIVNVSSLSAKIPMPYFTMYGSTKAFIEHYSVCLTAELLGVDSNVQVKCLQPFFVKTQLLKGVEASIHWGESLPLVGRAVLDVQSFASSAAATFDVNSPAVYQGHWTHQLLSFVIPYSVGLQTMANFVVWLFKYLKMDICCNLCNGNHLAKEEKSFLQKLESLLETATVFFMMV
ncbi:hypothetical protein GE061_006231 [Apolygus lucorum]|uniref:Uncharacterized protein n=1 Tax=Apolygus lucorum TaxID=248454 RepID=A0A8S9WTC3_APOLU|nr:hypothetical protein GE061_006231 [Apolygus lucorum]